MLAIPSLQVHCSLIKDAPSGDLVAKTPTTAPYGNGRSPPSSSFSPDRNPLIDPLTPSPIIVGPPSFSLSGLSLLPGHPPRPFLKD